MCMAYVYVRVLAWCNVHVRTAAQTHVCVCDCMCTIACLKVSYAACAGVDLRIVRAMCVSAHAYTAARVYVCVRACSWK